MRTEHDQAAEPHRREGGGPTDHDERIPYPELH